MILIVVRDSDYFIVCDLPACLSMLVCSCLSAVDYSCDVLYCMSRVSYYDIKSLIEHRIVVVPATIYAKSYSLTIVVIHSCCSCVNIICMHDICVVIDTYKTSIVSH